MHNHAARADEVQLVESVNFEFLRARRAVLADLAGFAERYAHDDPTSSLVKQRTFVEHAVSAIYERYLLHEPQSDHLIDRLNDTAFRQAVPDVVLNKLHMLRRAGNEAAHPRRPITSRSALDGLATLFDIARWFATQIDGATSDTLPKYRPPPPEPASAPKTRDALEQLRRAEERYEAILKRLDDESRKRVEAERTASEASRTASENAAELARLRDAGQKVASALHFDETTTRRRLIDQALIAAGWNVGDDGRSTEQVAQELKLSGLPTPSGHGFADYVLHGDDGKPLGVVEAKKTASDARAGGEQARQYADALEKATGVRPVVFFTNGIDIFLWDDARGGPFRKIYGFYSKDSLEYLVHKRTGRKALANVATNPVITDRMYQVEAVKRVCERFENHFRKALIVQATGTGKTRVAVSLCDVLMRAGWVKRILFLCDRKELRRQADRVFKEYMPGEPRVIVDASTAHDRDKRIYLATYPAMDEAYEKFDVGFFDLVIADESHRSIYRKYRSIFQYFDALQVGLTATPVRFIERNTYELFGCENGDPTSAFDFHQAIESRPPVLVPFRVVQVDTRFTRDGFRYSQMSAEQRAELEDQEPQAQAVEYDSDDFDRHFFNRDTTRAIWREVMDGGIREATGQHVGKTIVFARNHLHAVHLAEVFSDLYPQYGSTFCRVIDNQEPRAEQLIDDFKNPDHELTIAISVDMLDTGIDVPEVVNLVFARPVKSYVKFWQMIGRGTRLRKDLFGPGNDKKEFLIFDHWRNFWFFDEKYREADPAPAKSLLQRLFEARVELLAVAIERMDETAIAIAEQQILGDIRAVRDTRAIDVRDRWKELELLADADRIHQFSPATRADLLSIVAPLQHHRNIRSEEEAYQFDLDATCLQIELLKGGPGSPRVSDLKGTIQDAVEMLGKNLQPVRAKADAIRQVRDREFWRTVEVQQVEGLRNDLRTVMKYKQRPTTSHVALPVYDVTDDGHRATPYVPKREGLDLAMYRARVMTVLERHFANNPVLQRIRGGQPVREAELEDLARLVLSVDDQANITHLAGHDPATRRSLLSVFRGLVGLDADTVERAFSAFVHAHPRLSSRQLQFLQLLQNHIVRNGGIEIDRLYEAPFTDFDPESLEGVFPQPGEIDALLDILSTFSAPHGAPDHELA